MKISKKSLFIILASVVALSFIATAVLVVYKTPYIKFKSPTLQAVTFEEYKLDVTFRGGFKNDIVWFSDNPKVASVTGGKLTALKEGEAVVTAAIGDKTTKCVVSVSKNPINRAMFVSQTSVVLEIGQSTNISAKIRESGQEITNDIEWTSANTNVAEVDALGNITAIARGKTVITAYSYFNGQHLFKDIVVSSVYYKADSAQFNFVDASRAEQSNATLTKYLGNAEGFLPEDDVFEYKARGGDAALIFPPNIAGQTWQADYQRLIFKVKLGVAMAGEFNAYLASSKPITANASLITSSNALIFYTPDGKIASEFIPNTVYSVVINLAKAGGGTVNNGVNFGITFTENNDILLSMPIICSEDYYIKNYDFEAPIELPRLYFVKSETWREMKSLKEGEVGYNELYDFEEYWTTTTNSNLWENRVTVGGVDANMYRKYSTYGFDVIFTDEFSEIRVWNGGSGMVINGITGKRTVSAGEELKIYKVSDGSIVPDETPLLPNVKYRFEITIDDKNESNESFGIAVAGASQTVIILANPFFK